MLRDRARHTGYPFHSPVAPSLPLPRFAVCHVILIALCLLDLNGQCSFLVYGTFLHEILPVFFFSESDLLITKLQISNYETHYVIFPISYLLQGQHYYSALVVCED
jgi:hypothetical protein